MSADQLSLFEPKGPEVLALAQRHEKLAAQRHQIAWHLYQKGWDEAAKAVERSAAISDDEAVQMYMLAEFEALAGLS